MNVKDLDPLMKTYEVVGGRGRILGRKEVSGYYKPMRGKRICSFEELRYKAEPPWMRLEVAEIIGRTIIVKEEKNG